MDAQQKLHIVMVPWLAYGHIMPYLRVSIFLAQKGHRVSFVSTPKNLHTLRTITKLPPLLTFVDLPLPPVAGLPPGAESTADVPLRRVPLLKTAFDLLQPSLAGFLASSPTVHWIVHDFNSHWLPQLASRLGVNSGFLSVFNASSHAFSGPPEELLGGATRREARDYTVVPRWIPYPSTVAFRLHELVGHGGSGDSGVSDTERIARVLQGSRFVAVRSCLEFEPDALSLLGKLYRKPVVPVGFLPVDGDESDEKWEFLREWLDGKKEKSVVYIAFGTELTPSQESVRELARGVEKSGLPFIWVIRNKDEANMLPSGFESRVSGRGLVWVGFAPQVRVLGHRTVGGFLTHSGWSSVIEALGLGKSLILFPGAGSDQGLVARLMEEKRVGLEIVRDERDGSFTCESVAESVRRVVVDEEGVSLRANAWSARGVFGNVELQNTYLEEFCNMLEKEAFSTYTITL